MIINFIKAFIKKLRAKKLQNKLAKIGFGKLGENVRIAEGFDYSYASNIYVEDHVVIGYQNSFFALGEIRIGSGTVFAERVVIRTGAHNYNSSDLASLPFDGRIYCRPVIIGDNCWIGSNVIILPGVTIGEGVVIGAGSVVTKDIEALAVAAGNPAKTIKYRNKEVYESLEREGKKFVKDMDRIERKLIHN